MLMDGDARPQTGDCRMILAQPFLADLANRLIVRQITVFAIIAPISLER